MRALYPVRLEFREFTRKHVSSFRWELGAFIDASYHKAEDFLALHGRILDPEEAAAVLAGAIEIWGRLFTYALKHWPAAFHDGSDPENRAADYENIMECVGGFLDELNGAYRHCAECIISSPGCGGPPEGTVRVWPKPDKPAPPGIRKRVLRALGFGK